MVCDRRVSVCVDVGIVLMDIDICQAFDEGYLGTITE